MKNILGQCCGVGLFYLLYVTPQMQLRNSVWLEVSIAYLLYLALHSILLTMTNSASKLFQRVLENY